MKIIKYALKNELPFFFICPALLWQVLFLYVPLLVLLGYSFFEYSIVTNTFSFTLSHYWQVVRPFSLKIMWNSFLLAFETTVICFLISYPMAYFMAFKVKRFRMLYLFFLILPSWTSLIMQIYAWIFLLKKDGFLSQFLYQFGFVDQQVHMLNNHFSILVGMVYCYLPFMILPLYAVLEKIDKRLLEASADLGANRFVTIRKVIFPLSLSGIIVGVFLVFIPAFGEFAIPEFLGGAKRLFWGNVIVAKFLDYRDWHAGSATVCIGVLIPVVAVFLLYLICKVVKKIMMRPLQSKKNGVSNG